MKLLSFLCTIWLSLSPWLASYIPLPSTSAGISRRVTNAADSGPGSLRQIISEAQAGDTITFKPATFPVEQPTTIFLLSSLPAISQNEITLDASGVGVILDGSQTSPGTNGLTITADDCIVQGLTIQNFPEKGVLIEAGAANNTIGGDRAIGAGPNGQGNHIHSNRNNGLQINGLGADNNRIVGNFIGVDASGWWEAGNAHNGIAIWLGAQHNLVGGSASQDRNLIGGNGHSAIWIAGPGTDYNVVSGNYLGVRIDGEGPLGNRYAGVAIQDGAQANRIGGALQGEGNLISGNQDNGIYISDLGTKGNLVLGNIIGLNHSGDSIIGQGLNGIHITLGAQNNIIGSPGAGNLISGNGFDGILLEGSGTTNHTIQGNIIGANHSGTAALPNGLHGVELAQQTNHNLVGGSQPAGEGNLISGNANHGIVITGTASYNEVQGNLLGPDATGTYSLGNHPNGAIDITGGALWNTIGGPTPDKGNLISGNPTDGIALFDAIDTQIINNIIGLSLDGSHALPNGGPGIFHVTEVTGTQILSNTISGNRTHGIQLSGYGDSDAVVSANRIGTDQEGKFVVPNGAYGIYISEDAQGHIIKNNLIGGNLAGGVMLRNGGGPPPKDNIMQDNWIGLNSDGQPLANLGPGITISETAANNTIGPGNKIAFNTEYGVDLRSCSGSTITANSIYSNTLAAIHSECLAAPQLYASSPTQLTGQTIPDGRVEFFADAAGQSRYYLGFAAADASGIFSYTLAEEPYIPNITANVTSPTPGNTTSSLSAPLHLSWTILLYLNGDNDLSEAMFETVDSLAAAGPVRYANVLALLDGYTTTLTSTHASTGTLLYNLSDGQVVPISATLDLSATVPGELNMGDGKTLSGFTAWAQDHYAARYTLLSLVDHGGGWTPSPAENSIITDTLRHRWYWFSGGSGMSWDFTSDYDYLDIQETRQTLAQITANGAQPLDILFFDVCLMGMAEVAYQVKDYTDYFIASQNIGWAPLGPQNRYVRAVHAITPSTTPDKLASLLVQAYADSLPPEGHPYTISAIDTDLLDELADAANQFGTAVSNTLGTPQQAAELKQIYLQSQKIDYDSDLFLETETDGFVDLYDFAKQARLSSDDPTVQQGAAQVLSAVEAAVLAERHHSGGPWFAPERIWDLDDTHGLSIFLPLGEDLELPIVVTETVSISPSLIITRHLRLRDQYNAQQLNFLQNNAWNALIDSYYQVILPSVPTDTTSGPVSGLLSPDTSPPQTTIAVTGAPVAGQVITVSWTATDTQSGIASAALWFQPLGQEWQDSGLAQSGTSGVFILHLPGGCAYRIAVRAIDQAGNLQPLGLASNTQDIYVDYCLSLPIIAEAVPKPSAVQTSYTASGHELRLLP